jgi:hypothetical protein
LIGNTERMAHAARDKDATESSRTAPARHPWQPPEVGRLDGRDTRGGIITGHFEATGSFTAYTLS